MPLFMFLSGYIALGRPIDLSKKFRLLVIPFISWYLVWYFVAGVYRSTAFGDYLIHLYRPPDDRLWFLWILFLNFCVLELSLKSRLVGKDLAIVLAVVLTKFIPGEMLDIPLLRWYFLFFAVGYLVAEHKVHLEPLKRPLIATTVVAFPILISFWYRLDDPGFVPALHEIVDSYSPWATDIAVFTYKLAVPLLGISLALAAPSALSALGGDRLLAWLGLMSLDIYVSHQVFMFAFGISWGEGVLAIASASILAIFLSLVLASLLRRVKLLNTLLLGGRDAGTPGPSRLGQGFDEQPRSGIASTPSGLVRGLDSRTIRGWGSLRVLQAISPKRKRF